MGESDVSLMISAAVVFPIIVVIAGCVICRRLCGEKESEDEERRPLLTGSTGQQRRQESVENEQLHRHKNEPERRSPHSHSVITRVQLEQNEERIEEARQQEAQPVVVAEAPLIPDLLRIDEQEPDNSHQTESDILEPRPFPEGQLIPNLEDIQDQPKTRDVETEQVEERKVITSESQAPKQPTEEADVALRQGLMPDQEQFLKTTTLEDNDTIQIETESERAVFQTVTDVKQRPDVSLPDKVLENEAPQDMQEPPLPTTADANLSAQIQDPKTNFPATALLVEQQEDAPAVVSPSVESHPVNSTADKETREDTIVEGIIQDDPPASLLMDQSQAIKDIKVPAAALDKNESQKAEEKIEEQINLEDPSTSMRQQSEEVKETPDEADRSVGEQSGQVTEHASEVKINFDVIPTFVKTIRTKAAKKESKSIFGLTILNGELFIINEHSPDVEVYDSQSMTFRHKFHLDGLFDPVDIKASSKHNCIYIFDWKGDESNEILRVASDGRLITKWKTGDEGGYISVTLEANVILSVWDKSLLKEFTSDGQLLREIQLSADISELRLAVKLPNGHFIISQGEGEQSEHRVCLVDDKGAVVKSIGGKQGSSNGEFYSPNYLVVDGSGFILVADQNNRRVVLLSPELEFKKEVIQERDDLRYPVRMELDRASGRLFVADNDYLENHTGWRDGRVMAFDFTVHQ